MEQTRSNHLTSVPHDGQWRPVGFDRLHGWQDDDHLSALHSFCKIAESGSDLSGLSPAMAVRRQDLIDRARAAINQQIVNSADARRFFEENFQPHMCVASDPAGFVTGYFEPECDAALQATAAFSVPLYRRPPELVKITPDNRPATLDADLAFGRQVEGTITEFYDRQQIQSGALAGRGLELVWLKDRVTAYFIHVQGSALLKLPDGQRRRIGYAAKSGHPYTSLGKLLCERLEVTPSEMTADRLAAWMHAHPDELDAFMAQNRSYIFFEMSQAANLAAIMAEGPLGAARIALTPGRSLAIDQTIHTYGTPIWVSTDRDLLNQGRDFNRLMVAEDTGSAIVGPQRGDIFVGSGDKAGYLAGQIQVKAQMFTLVPRT